MRKKENYLRPATEEERTAEVKCDLCGRVAPNPDGWDMKGKWGRGYDIESVIVGYRSGSQYPEGGSWKTIFYDVCPQCFQKHIIQFFKQFGVEPQIREKEFD